MNNDVSKRKLEIQDIMNEIANIKRYNNELHNNCRGDKLEDYLNKLNNNITQAQIKLETIYTKASK